MVQLRMLKTGLIRLFVNHTYNSSLIYRTVKKYRILQFGDSSDCIIKLMELGNIHKSKEGIVEMTSDNGEGLETLYWSSPLSNMLCLTTGTEIGDRFYWFVFSDLDGFE